MFALVVEAPKEIPAPLLWLWLSIPIIALTQLGVVQKRGRFWKNLDHLPGQVYSSITSTCISTPDEVGWGQTTPDGFDTRANASPSYAQNLFASSTNTTSCSLLKAPMCSATCDTTFSWSQHCLWVCPLPQKLTVCHQQYARQ